MEDTPSVLLDLGSGSVKAGFSGDNAPAAVFPSLLGRPKQPQALLAVASKGTYVGQEATAKRGLLYLTHPIERGVVRDWDDLETLVAHAYLNELRAAPEEHPALLTEAPLNPSRNREQLTELMFEKFNVPYLFVSLPSFLALFASGRTTGIVVDCGAGVTHAVPIWEGNALPSAITRIDCAGHDLTAYLLKIINERGQTLQSGAEMELCREMKEKFGYVAKKFDVEMQYARTSPQAVAQTYALPDGRTLELVNEHFRCAEALFQPAVIGQEGKGIHEITYQAIMRAPVDLRLPLYNNIVLTGGSTCFRGLPDRMRVEMIKAAPLSVGSNVTVFADDKRKHQAFTGASIFASILSAYSSMWVSKDEYREQGTAAVRRKCY